MDTNTLIGVLGVLVPILLYMLKINNDVIKNNVMIKELKEDIQELKKCVWELKKMIKNNGR